MAPVKSPSEFETSSRRLQETCPIGGAPENSSVFAVRPVHSNVLDVPISLRERFRVVVYVVCRTFVHSTAWGFENHTTHQRMWMDNPSWRKHQDFPPSPHLESWNSSKKNLIDAENRVGY